MSSGRKTGLVVSPSLEVQRQLESWQRSTTIPSGLARRARVILLLSSGVSVSEVSRRVGIERCHVYKWARRFIQQGIDGLHDSPGRGRKPPASPLSLAPDPKQSRSAAG